MNREIASDGHSGELYAALEPWAKSFTGSVNVAQEK